MARGDEGVTAVVAKPGSFALSDIDSLCQSLNIRMVEHDRLYCCRAPMQIGYGPWGMDYARCFCCGKTIANVASPRINAGSLAAQRLLQGCGGRTWLESAAQLA